MEKINFVDDSEPSLSAEVLNKLQKNIESAIEALYPVGSVYMNLSDNANPADLLGFGTWERIKDKFIYALGDEGNVGDTGGSATHSHTQASKTGSTTLTASQSGMQSHAHELDGWTIKWGTDTSNATMINAGMTNGNPSAGNYPHVTASATNNASSRNATDGHTHTLGSTNEASSLPPYEKAYCWKRIS